MKKEVAKNDKVVQQKRKNHSSSKVLLNQKNKNSIQFKHQKLVENSNQVSQLKSIQDMANNSVEKKTVLQKKSNNTNLPTQLKSGIENLSGISMDDVKVHYNSSKPAQLQAHAYAQGTNIHLGPGQEKHLPHEAWHVVQQKQGRVKPTMQLKGKVNVNDDVGLEREADVMGAKATQLSFSKEKNIDYSSRPLMRRSQTAIQAKLNFESNPTVQRMFIFNNFNYTTLEGILSNPEAKKAYEANEDKSKQSKLESKELKFVLNPNGSIIVFQNEKNESGEPQSESSGPTGGALVVHTESHKPKEGDDEVLELSREGQGNEDIERAKKVAKFMALLYLPLAILWQNFQEHRGRKARGHGPNAARGLSLMIESVKRNGEQSIELLKRMDVVRSSPVKEGFKLGVNPLPMPFPTERASLEDIKKTFFQLTFLLTTSEEEINRLIHEVASSTMDPRPRISMKNPGKAKSIKTPFIADMLKIRRNLMIGFGAGSVTGSSIFTGLGAITGFTHPTMILQIPWDIVNVLNSVAVQSNTRLSIELEKEKKLEQEIQFELFEIRNGIMEQQREKLAAEIRLKTLERMEAQKEALDREQARQREDMRLRIQLERKREDMRARMQQERQREIQARRMEVVRERARLEQVRQMNRMQQAMQHRIEMEGRRRFQQGFSVFKKIVKRGK